MFKFFSGFAGERSIMGNVNEILHDDLQFARVVAVFPELRLENYEFLFGLLPFRRKGFKSGGSLQLRIALKLKINALRLAIFK